MLVMRTVMRVDAHFDVAWNALSQGHGFVGRRVDGYLIDRTSLADANVGLIFATLFCGPHVARKRRRPVLCGLWR